MEGAGVKEERLAEKTVGVSIVWKRGEHVGGRNGVRGLGDLVGREEIVTVVWGGGDGTGGEVVELL